MRLGSRHLCSTSSLSASFRKKDRSSSARVGDPLKSPVGGYLLIGEEFNRHARSTDAMPARGTRLAHVSVPIVPFLAFESTTPAIPAPPSTGHPVTARCGTLSLDGLIEISEEPGASGAQPG